MDIPERGRGLVLFVERCADDVDRCERCNCDRDEEHGFYHDLRPPRANLAPRRSSRLPLDHGRCCGPRVKDNYLMFIPRRKQRQGMGPGRRAIPMPASRRGPPGSVEPCSQSIGDRVLPLGDRAAQLRI